MINFLFKHLGGYLFLIYWEIVINGGDKQGKIVLAHAAVNNHVANSFTADYFIDSTFFCGFCYYELVSFDCLSLGKKRLKLSLRWVLLLIALINLCRFI